MTRKNAVALTIIVFLATALPRQAAAAGDPDPLFASHDTLTVRIDAPFAQIMKDRPNDSDQQVPATFTYVESDGSEVEFDVRILTRGNNRRNPDVCQFAPLRLNFKKGDLDDTLFDKQDKLKLVTHCENGRDAYQQHVIREYLAYRVLNAVTDISFRVRLLRMTYGYTDDDKEEDTYAFFIESDERLAKRIGLDEQKLPAMSIVVLDQEYTNLTSIFEFLIGNLDFSPVIGASGETCCHNYAVFSADNKTYWSIPYDFDLTGFVEAPHIQLNPEHRQQSIRQRKYRGHCYNNAYIPASLQKFRDARPEIEAVIAAQPELDKSHRKRIESYIGSFYKLLEKEERLVKRLEKSCLG